jgi:2-polyprenyl-6-methoxyphenol hydroxylase-like FAD-dependent oxidoreductase
MTSSGCQRRAIVAGGSVAGLFLGNLLVRSGWQVDIFERATGTLVDRGAGIADHPELTCALEAILGSDSRLDRIDINERIAFDFAGRVVARRQHPQYVTSWNAVFGCAHQAFPASSYHSGVEVLDVYQSEHGATVSLSDGRALSADLVVGADGIRSRLRTKLAPETTARYAQYVAWRGVIDDVVLLEAGLASYFSFCFPQGGQFIGYPLLGEAGRRRYNFLWYYRVPEGDDLDDLFTDANGRRHGHAIPPHLIRPAHIDALCRAALERLPPRFSNAVMSADRYMLQPIYDVQSRQIAFDRVALIGDAAFVARPHVGIGVLKAAQDAIALARCLDRNGSVSAALLDYQGERLTPGIEAVRFGRRLGAFIELGLDDPISDPRSGLTYDFILSESARLPRREALEGGRLPNLVH